MLGKKIERVKKEKQPSKEADLKEIKRKLDVEKEKERRKEVQRKQQPQQEILTPNNTLFVENLLPSVTESNLTNLFSQHSGFK